jgi:hypothetical protein
MNMPGFTANASLYRSEGHYHTSGAAGLTTGGPQVLPQACVSSPCLRLGGGRFCINLPLVGRQCVTIPGLGSWRIRCCVRFGWPPISCSVSRC